MSDALLARIPAFPPVVLRALDLLANDDVQVGELVSLIESDAVFSSQTLKVANSPLFGFRQQIESVQRAIVALGLARIQAVTMSVATANYLKAALRTDELYRCWRHTLASAIISRETAGACGIAEERAYTAGLLHDIGRLGLLVAYPDEYAEMLRRADRVQEALLDKEKQLFGMDHCEAGRCLVEKWGFPPEFRLITGRHHDPPSGGNWDLLAHTHLACQLADALGFSVVKPMQVASFESLLEKVPPSARSRFPAAEALTAPIDGAIGSHDLAVFSANRTTGALARDSEEAGIEIQSPASVEKEPPSQAGMFAGLPARPILWDLSLVSVTLLVFLGVFLTCYFLWRR